MIKESGVAMAFRVFFVDDDQENRMIIGEILEFNHVDHTIAENGQQQWIIYLYKNNRYAGICWGFTCLALSFCVVYW